MLTVGESVLSHGRQMLGVALLVTSGAALGAPATATWNATGTPFSFNNITLQSFSNVDVIGGTSFTTQGYLNLFSFQNGSTLTQLPNLGFTGGSPYSIFIQFSGTGTQTASSPSVGSFSTLNYTMYQASGVTSFADTNSDGIFEATGGPTTTLGTGALIPGSSLTTVSPTLASTASAATLFTPNPAAASFFVNPDATTILNVSTAFTATGTATTFIPLAGGDFRLSINGGGGNATVSAIPEPAVYAMMLSGLGLVGFAARRRKTNPC